MIKKFAVAAAVAVAVGGIGASSASANFGFGGGTGVGGAFEVVGGNQDVVAGILAKGDTERAFGGVAVRSETIDPSALFVQYTGAVDCVYTVGNEAWVSGKITFISGPASSNPTTGKSKYFLWSLEDNGPAGGTPKDRVAFTRSPTPFNCQSRLRTARDILRGDITVKNGSVTTQQ